MIYAKSESYFTVWRGDIKDKYGEFNLSSSRKDKRDGTYKNSNWSFVRFVGDAFEKCKSIRERDRITNVTFSLEWEPYTNNMGEKVYAKSPRMVIFDFEVAAPVGKGDSGGGASRKPRSKPYAEPEVRDDEGYMASGESPDDEEDDFPF